MAPSMLTAWLLMMLTAYAACTRKAIHTQVMHVCVRLGRVCKTCATGVSILPVVAQLLPIHCKLFFIP